MNINGYVNTTGRPRFSALDDKDKLINLYLENDCSWNKVANTLGVSRSAIQIRVKEYNLTLEYFLKKYLEEKQ